MISPLASVDAGAIIGDNTTIGDFSVAESVANQCLSLPIFPELTDEQVNTVIDVIQGVF